MSWPKSLFRFSCKMLWKTRTDFLANSINMQLLFSPAFALLGIYSREVKTYVYTKTCTQILKVESKFCLLYDSIYVTFWKGENLGNRKQIIGCQGPGLGEQRIRREFYGTDHNGGSIIEWMDLSKSIDIHWKEWILLHVSYTLINLTKKKKRERERDYCNNQVRERIKCKMPVIHPSGEIRFYYIKNKEFL